MDHLDMHDIRSIATSVGSSQDTVTELKVTADEAHVAAVQSDVSLQAGSFAELCPISRKPLTAGTAVHKAVIQQQHSHTAQAQDAASSVARGSAHSKGPQQLVKQQLGGGRLC